MTMDWMKVVENLNNNCRHLEIKIREADATRHVDEARAFATTHLVLNGIAQALLDGIKFKEEKDCPRCEGTGYAAKRDDDLLTGPPCAFCRGVGKITA